MPASKEIRLRFRELEELEVAQHHENRELRAVEAQQEQIDRLLRGACLTAL